MLLFCFGDVYCCYIIVLLVFPILYLFGGLGVIVLVWLLRVIACAV